MERISTALFLIFLGVLFLLGNLSIISFSNLLALLFRFWPVFLVLGGVKIMLGIVSWGKYFGLVLDILVFGLIILALLYPSVSLKNEKGWVFNPNINITNESFETTVKKEDFPGEDIKSYELDLKIGASHFKLEDNDSEDLLSIKGDYTANAFKPKVVSEMSDSDLVTKVTQEKVNGMFFNMFPSYTSDFTFSLGKNEITTSLKLNLGAGDGEIKIDDTMLEVVDVNVGAGALEMELNSRPSQKLVLDVGAGDVTVVLPKDTNISLEYNVGVGGLELLDDSKRIKDFGGLASKGKYDYTPVKESSYLLPIKVNVGAGAVQIVFK